MEADIAKIPSNTLDEFRSQFMCLPNNFLNNGTPQTLLEGELNERLVKTNFFLTNHPELMVTDNANMIYLE